MQTECKRQGNVILYGVRQLEMRRDIEFFLDDGWNILGYSDSFCDRDSIDGKPFFPLESLAASKADFIIPLSYAEETINAIRETLLCNGVEAGRILTPLIFLRHGKEKCQTDLMRHIQEDYRGEQTFIFGLSYSLCGIRKALLPEPAFDFSMNGLDLYYNCLAYRHLKQFHSPLYIKHALLFFPYYYFNYDLSHSLRQYTNGMIFSVHGFHDWHNYKDVQGAWEVVQNYELFGEKISAFYHIPAVEIEDSRILEHSASKIILNKTWEKNYPDTVKENRDIFRQFLAELCDDGAEISIIIPPVYKSDFSPIALRFFDQKRKQFYSIVSEYAKTNSRVRLYDMVDTFEDAPELFCNETHLNSCGAVQLTHQIRQFFKTKETGIDR